MTSQNLCLICCYSYPEKPNRFISSEAQQSFYQFGTQLGLSLPSSGGSGSGGGKLKGGLRLPFGEAITVCGDCLSLVGVYVQQRGVLREKEEKVAELQRQVCQALKEVNSVAEEVTAHVEHLKETVKSGDEGKVGRFLPKRPIAKQKEREAKAFRSSILALTSDVAKFKKSGIPRLPEEPMIIKMEPSASALEEISPSFWNDDDPLSLSPPPPGGSSHPEPGTSFSSFTKSSRRSAAKKPRYSEDEPAAWLEDDDGGAPDFSDREGGGGEDSDDGSVSSDHRVKKRQKRGPYKKRKRPHSDSKAARGGTSVIFGTILGPEEAAAWKANLLARIASATPTAPSCPKIEGDDLDLTPSSSEENDSFQITSDQLHLRGISIPIYESKRMLECGRCWRRFFEERDCKNAPISLESLIKTHILEKHCAPKPPKPPPLELEMIRYTSCTKTKLTYKIADKNGYSYTRGNLTASATYYRCDNRRNCSACVVLKNGRYFQCKKGWGDASFHASHPPDVARTRKQIAIGNAKEMYMKDDTRSINEVVEDILHESGGAEGLPIPVYNLKRCMVYSKHGTRGMAPEERKNLEEQCCFCGKFFKTRQSLSKHMRVKHQEGVPSYSQV